MHFLKSALVNAVLCLRNSSKFILHPCVTQAGLPEHPAPGSSQDWQHRPLHARLLETPAPHHTSIRVCIQIAFWCTHNYHKQMAPSCNKWFSAELSPTARTRETFRGCGKGDRKGRQTFLMCLVLAATLSPGPGKIQNVCCPRQTKSIWGFLFVLT